MRFLIVIKGAYNNNCVIFHEDAGGDYIIMSQVKRMKEEFDARGYGEVPDKNICPQCVLEESLAGFIRDNADAEMCDYCNKEGIALSLEVLMPSIMESIKTEWDDVENQGIPYDKEDDRYMCPTYDTTELVNDEIEELYDSNQEFKNDLIEVIGWDRRWCQLNPFVPSKAEILESRWANYCKVIREVEKMFSDIVNYTQQFGLIASLKTGTSIFRARNSQGEFWANAKDLGAPPIKAAAANRMTREGVSAFYGAFTPQTCMYELFDENKPYFSIGEFRLKKDLNIVDFTRILPLPSVFDEAKRALRETGFFLQRFAQEISKPIDYVKDKDKYIETQFLCQYFRDSEKRLECRVDGICYYSAKTGRTICSRQRERCLVLFVEHEQCFGKDSILELKDFKHHVVYDKDKISDIVI